MGRVAGHHARRAAKHAHHVKRQTGKHHPHKGVHRKRK